MTIEFAQFLHRSEMTVSRPGELPDERWSVR